MTGKLQQLLTGIDGRTQDLGRWLGVFGGGTGIVMPVYDTVANHVPWNSMTFGAGMGALALGVGAMLKLKIDSEPPADGQPPKPP